MRCAVLLVSLIACGAKSPRPPAAPSDDVRRACYERCLELGPSSGGQGERSETWASASNADKDEACKADCADAK